MHYGNLTIAALVLSAVACGGDSVSPLLRREITLNLCGAMWAAYQNEGEEWTSFSSTLGEPLGRVTFAATERLGIATVSQVGGPYAFETRLDVHYLSAEQAEAAFACVGLGSGRPSGKRLNGSVAGVGPENGVLISTGRDLATASAFSPTFQVRAAEDGPTDIVAVERLPLSDSPPSGRINKIIIRRGENHADGATMPVLDFSSSEAVAPESNTLTVGGLSVGTAVSVQTHFRTARAASVNLRYDFDQTSQVLTTYSVPATRLADGDVHQVYAFTSNKELWFFYRSPSDRTMTFGPAPSTPALTQAAGSGQVLRIDVASQPEYGSWVSVFLTTPQPATSSDNVSIIATSEYFGGTPATWSLVLPDLTDVPGFSPLWGLSAGGKAWRLTASSAPLGFTLAAGRDGDVYRSATAVGGILIAQ